jgi:hypothetical protein
MKHLNREAMGRANREVHGGLAGEAYCRREAKDGAREGSIISSQREYNALLDAMN